MDTKEKIRGLPESPGVYIMKGASGEVLYVGKAKNLRRRVSSYFRPGRESNERLRVLASKVEDIEYLTAATEAEALIYENGLIKELRPKYNIALRDDKSYPMLKLTVNERFPRLIMTRQKRADGALYYGPYSSAGLLREAIGILRVLFPLRTCRKIPKKVCLNYHIKQCPGPCVHEKDEGRYNETVGELKLFLEGKRRDLLRALSDRMSRESRLQNFEEAARIRQRIEALGSLKEKSIQYGPALEAKELGSVLGLKLPIDRIEAFDVSNIMGTSSVGSMVVFGKGRPVKSEYRKFRIKGVSKIDDYAMMREIVSRRYTRLLRDGSKPPDLIIIDGGKGHLSSAVAELEKLGLGSVPAIGIAKPARLEADRHQAGGEFEHIYTRHRSEPMSLPKESKALHLLKRIRDEAHRFAISYHKKLLSKKVEASELDDIKLIGPKRKRALLRRFGSVGGIRKASFGDILGVGGMSEKAAKGIIDYFKGR